ncbi:glycoside hydrolase family 71 protein [Xylariaceae sp. FL0804]|nr:glycoside hydrolase family 71 protein [Xylariaceae sp. FL0804]
MALLRQALAGLLLSLLAAAPALATNPVYAHFMVGIVGSYTVDDWKTDMSQAQAIGIDGFALNCAPPSTDSFTPQQLANAYQAAEELGGGFTVFISFDFSYWTDDDAGEIADLVGNYSASAAQAYYDGGAIVSTFVGDTFDWTAVKDALPDVNITALPNIEDPTAIPTDTGLDGVLSWYAWPTDGDNSIIPGPMTTKWDDEFISSLDGKPYMAPVSPWFFTHFSSKNWVFICEELPTQRWEEILSLKPELVEIITWNDFGESHYIVDSEPDHSDDGSSAWASGFPHSAWGTLMAPYIAAYKAGADAPTVTAEQLVYWYRPTPKDTVCTGDALAQPDGVEYLSDVVFVATMLTAPANLTVTSGDQAAPVTVAVDAGIQTTNFTMGVGAQTFAVTRGDGEQVMGGTGGLDIADSCTTYNYNAYVGSFSAA